MDRQPLLMQRLAQRRHQERHIVGHHLDDGMARLPAIAVDLGAEHPHQRSPGRTHRSELPQRQRRPVESLGRRRNHVRRRDSGRELAHEPQSDIDLVAPHPLPNLLQHPVDKLTFQLFGP